MRILIVCGSPAVSSPSILKRLSDSCDAVVAVDRGLDALIGAGLSCDMFVGDADTVSDTGRELVEAGDAFDVERFDPYKDATDLSLALAAVIRRWPGSDVVATCASGGKPDLALSVLGQLSAYDAGAVSIVEDGFEARILHAGMSWDIAHAQAHRFSVVALSCGTIVSERGFEWELDRASLPFLGDQGISNFVKDEVACVSCDGGTAIAYLFSETSPLA